MKITMLSVGSIGDVRPFILLGRELKRRGCEITIAAFPRFRVPVQEAGLLFAPLDGSAEDMIQAVLAPDTSGVNYLPRLVRQMKDVIPGLITSMVESCRDADGMICNYFGSIYYSIAEKFRIPCVQVHFFPMDPTGDVPISSIRNQHLGHGFNRASYKAGYLLIGLIEKHYLSPWRRSNGLAERPVKAEPDYRIGDHTIPVIYPISPSLFPRPAEWDRKIHMSGFWFEEEPDRFTPSQDLQAFLEEEADPPVYIGFGSMNGGNMSSLLAQALRAVRDCGVRAVIHLGWSGRSFPSNRTVFFTEYIPHEWLFPRVRAVVHHGGAGTTAAGLRYGLPTMTIPFAGDQLFWGELVTRAGCGPRPLPCRHLTAEAFTGGLRDLLSNETYAKNAKKLAGKLAGEHGIQSAADLIENTMRSW